jgi:hypothetical protein
MFVCQYCQKHCGPKIKPRVRVLKDRPVDYLNKVTRVDPVTERVTTEMVSSHGREIVKEGQFCPTCVGEVEPTIEPLHVRRFMALAATHHAHARSCKGVVEVKHRGEKIMEPCKVCARGVTLLASFPLAVLSPSLAEAPSPKPRFSFAEVVLDTMMARTLEQSKRATADAKAALFALKTYENLGGKLQPRS